MPKRTDIKTILVLGSGPIVIGQGCEFDYSGTQACKALKAEGYRIVLVNSNPATIMTDPSFSDRTYIEPITPESVRKIIERENFGRCMEGVNADDRAHLTPVATKIDAILPTLGGQTALNCACALFDNGTLTEFGIEMIGANRKVIHRAEDRQEFKEICEGLGLKLPKAKTVNTLAAAEEFLKEIGLPAIIRPAFTLGGSGGGIAYNLEEFRDIISRGLSASMINQVQIDQSVIGWKEFELEVVRDKHDNCIIVCGIENIDPMGVHTGDSITVAPILTLTDKEYQAMRDAAFAIMRAVGVETGGSNVQFAVNPNPKAGPDGKKPFEMVVVEMNPRVSRSSALASKATGFPIAKIAAKLAIGYTLDELKNDITGTTSACFEPTIDYIVTKMPRWTFEKFPEADETLTTQMKSVGEAMAIGRTFKESLQKVIRSMDVKRFGLGLDRNDKWLSAMRAVESQQLVLDISPGAAPGTGSSDTGLRTADGSSIEWPIPLDKLTRKLAVPSQGRLYYVRYAMKMGWTVERIQALTNIDPFFLDQIEQLVTFEDTLCDYKHLEDVPAEIFFQAKQLGYSDAQLANLYLGVINPDAILKVRARRIALGIEPVYKLVDTCAAEFEAVTPYYYSTYERGAATGATPGHLNTSKPSAFKGDDEIRVTDRTKVVIIGGGPNRIGQGIEFDYCCCHAAFAARDMGFESVMINSNPETVSTDYDTSDLLFFEPLTLEDTLNVIERLNGQRLVLGTPALRAGSGSALGTPALRAGSGSALGTPALRAGSGSGTPALRAGSALGTPALRAGSLDWYERCANIKEVDAKVRRDNLKALHPLNFVGRDPYPPETYGAVHDLVRRGRYLPHLQLPGATYFVTWKTVEGIELSPADRDEAMGALLHFDGDRCRVYAAVVMSNHIHWIVRPLDGVDLDDLISSVKRFSSKQINARSGRTGSIWEPERFDHIIRDTGYFNKFVAYVVHNPVEAGLVASADMWRWTFVHQDADGDFSGSESRGTQDTSGLESRGTQDTSGSESRGTQDFSGSESRGTQDFSGSESRGTQNLVLGTIVQFGGQTPLNLAKGLVAAGVPIIGTSVDSIDRAEDRKRFDEVLESLKLRRPAAGIAHSLDQAATEAARIGYPVLIRPSYVLGGRGMEICYDEMALRSFMTTALETSGLDDAPVLIDKFLDGAIEVDVDVVADFSTEGPIPPHCRAVVTGIMEQIEQAGVHSGDSACTLPTASLPAEVVQRIDTIGKDMARALRVRGLMNIQLAVRQERAPHPHANGASTHEIYILEVNPRASRTVPFVSKATHTPWPAIAAKVMMGATLDEIGAPREALFCKPGARTPYYAVKESVFPFSKFPGVDVVLGPEMRSTGEVMGIDRDLAIAYAKSQMGSGMQLPTQPCGVFLSVREQDRDHVVEAAATLSRMGFKLYATQGTGDHLQSRGISNTRLQKIAAGARPNVLDLMHNGEVKLIINTPTRTGWQTDEGKIRATAVRLNTPMLSTATAAVAAARAIEAMRTRGWSVSAMQDFKVLFEQEAAIVEVREQRAESREQKDQTPAR